MKEEIEIERKNEIFDPVLIFFWYLFYSFKLNNVC